MNPDKDKDKKKSINLDLEGGNRPGLERAMAHLLGRKPGRVSASDSKAAFEQEVLKVLTEIGFEVKAGSGLDLATLSHPLTEGRQVELKLPDKPGRAEGIAFDFALTYFPEMEFYLPFLLARGRYKAANTPPKAASAGLGPEPEYDEDGFIAEG